MLNNNKIIVTGFPRVSQFHRCFLLLLRCERRLLDVGPASTPSRSTVVHLNRRRGPAPSGPAPPDAARPPCAVEAEGTSGAASEPQDAGPAPSEPSGHAPLDSTC